LEEEDETEEEKEGGKEEEKESGCSFSFAASLPLCLSAERWGAGVETQTMYGGRLGAGVEYHFQEI